MASSFQAQFHKQYLCRESNGFVIRFAAFCSVDRVTVADAIGYAKFFSRSHDAVIHFYGDAGNVIEMHDHKGDFKEWFYYLPQGRCSYRGVLWVKRFYQQNLVTPIYLRNCFK
jgi:hypothetical protein